MILKAFMKMDAFLLYATDFLLLNSNQKYFMQKQAIVLLSFLFLLNFGFAGNAQGNAGTPTTSDCGPINQTKLKELLVQLGYTPKDIISTPGKEKYEIKLNRGGLDVPMGLEISASTNYIWLTVFLGKAPADSSKYFQFLKQNSKIQPALFYVTDSGNMMMGLPVDNRGINNALLKRYTEFIAGKVADTKDTWQ
jgi:hypothetical protein